MIGIFDAQTVFRKILDAIARPGKVVNLPDISLNPPVENKYPFIMLFTLLDHEVCFSVLDAENRADVGAISRYITTNTGSSEATLKDADFILVYGGSSCGRIQELKRGTLEYPDESATLIYDVRRIGAGRLLTISGPGIRAECDVLIDGIGEDEITGMNRINSEFPLGVDAIFSDRYGNILAIPRSIKVEW